MLEGFWGDAGESIDAYYEVNDFVRANGANRSPPSNDVRLSPAITLRQRPPLPLRRQPACAADKCGLWLGASDREPGQHRWTGD